MPNIVIKFAKKKLAEKTRPIQCLYCSSPVLQRWGNGSRNLRDMQKHEIDVPRYRCAQCGRTFRYYPPEMDRANYSRRIKNLGALIYALGVSSREVVGIFQEQGVQLSHTTVWRDGNQLAELKKQALGEKSLKRYSIDRVYVPRVSQRIGVVVALDLGQGKRTIVGTVDESDPRLVKGWINAMSVDPDIEVVVLGTDLFEQHRLGNPLD
jgi:DNA-directed RNA polymerase subunit RPC12/RpoP